MSFPPTPTFFPPTPTLLSTDANILAFSNTRSADAMHQHDHCVLQDRVV
jgi:hypothetical protein